MTAGGLRVLTTHTDVPVMTKTTMQSDALHSLDVLTQCLIEEICIFLARLTVFDIVSPIQHPCRNLELERVADYGNDLIDLVRCKLAGTLLQVDVAFLADDVRKAATNTFNGREGEHHFLAAIDVRIAHTKNVLEILRLKLRNRHGCMNGLASNRRTLNDRN